MDSLKDSTKFRSEEVGWEVVERVAEIGRKGIGMGVTRHTNGEMVKDLEKRFNRDLRKIQEKG